MDCVEQIVSSLEVTGFAIHKAVVLGLALFLSRDLQICSRAVHDGYWWELKDIKTTSAWLPLCRTRAL